MEQSVLKYITTNNCAIYYEGWRNGKKGGFVQSEGVYYFCEMHPELPHNHIIKSLKDNPVAAVGVVSAWLQFKRDTDPFIKRVTKYINDYVPESIKQMFESVTQMEFKFIKEKHRDDPDTLDWDWDYEFYAKYIIPRSIELNKISEALFDYISDSDIVLIRKVMNAYIKYLKDCRKAKGFQISPRLMVLRGVHLHNAYMFEDLEDDVIDSIADKLEAEGYILRNWDEDHKIYDKVILLNKGLANMIQLESRATKSISPQQLQPIPQQFQPIPKQKTIEHPRTVDIDKITFHFRMGFDKQTHSSTLKTFLEQPQSDKELACVSLLIYNSKWFIKGDYTTFSKWYKDFCKFVMCDFHPSYEPNKLKPSEELKNKYYFLF